MADSGSLPNTHILNLLRDNIPLSKQNHFFVRQTVAKGQRELMQTKAEIAGKLEQLACLQQDIESINNDLYLVPNACPGPSVYRKRDGPHT